MKRITTKISATILLMLSVIFGVLSISAILPLSQPAFALPSGDETTDITPGNNSDNSNNSDSQDQDTNTPTTPPSTIIDPDDLELDPSDSTITNPGEDNPDAFTPGSIVITDENGEDHYLTPDDLNNGNPTASDACKEQAGSLYWIICPSTGVVAKAVDSIYTIIEDLLVVEPLTTDSTSPIYLVWQYARQLTNIVFIIFLIIVIYSQVTGLGINNYGIKRILPRLIIAVVLVNLSYIICTLAIDLSNIIGASLRSTFTSIEESLFAAGLTIPSLDISISSLLTDLIAGTSLAGLAITFTGGLGHFFWMIIMVLIGGLISVGIGLITIAARQAIVALLIMVAPLAFVAYLLPNTERLFEQWKNLLFRMLIFFPMFSFLFGASHLAGLAIIASAAASNNAFGVIMGVAVQILPLFLSWSLMKMSGTVLGTLNTALHRLVTPIQNTATGWASEHAEESRQNYFANSYSTGSRLRQYLDYRRDLRLSDTENAMSARRNRSLSQVHLTASSITGRDAYGNITYSKTPNRYTRNAKSASYYATLNSTSELAQRNVLTAYGRHFTDPTSTALSNLHGEAFLDSMAQQFLAVNEAESDQKALLDQYIAASKNRYRNSYAFNRLIKGAAGGLGHDGEASIMGQVIANSAAIEDRRKREAMIIATKFSVDKGKFRAMTYDMASISDNGRETNEDGIEIEDTEYKLITHYKDGTPTNFRRRKWQQYIGVHKTTNAEITKEEYDALSDEERRNYNKVRYYEILDDAGDPIQRVYDTDAGYMKTLLRNDIQIGDPINRRYGMTTGLAHADGEETGPLRRYHSTISAAIFETKYREHAAGFTSMLAAQIDRGFITSKGQLNIAEIQSFTASGKAGMLARNDGGNLKELAAHLAAMNDDDAFAYYFPDQDIATYRNVNGVHLDGWRLMTKKEGDKEVQYWEEINHNDPTITLEDQKNYLRYKVLPKCAAKVINSLDRRFSPGVLEDMKKDGLEGLSDLLDRLSKVAIEQANDQATNGKIDGSISIFDSDDPSVIQRRVRNTKDQIADILRPDDDTAPANDDTNPSTGNGGGGNGGSTGGRNTSGSNGGNNTGGSSRSSSRSGSNRSSSKSNSNPRQSRSRNVGVQQTIERLKRDKQFKEQKRQRNDYTTVTNIIDGYFSYPSDYETVAIEVLQYLSELEDFGDQYLSECATAVDKHRIDRSSSIESGIGTITRYDDDESDRIEALHQDIIDIIDDALLGY